MSVEYTWEITGLKTATLNNTPNVVVQTYWKKIGTDGVHTGTFAGATPFSSDAMPQGTSFVPFEQLTEEIVLNWIKASVVGASEAHVNSVILEDIERSKNPIQEVTPPWGTSSGTTIG
jgi:hypothetical protein